MSQERETGIVLSRKISGEADNICNIYTKNSGKDRFIFKGIKKSAKRPRSASEPGTVIDFIYYSSKSGGINTISEIDILSLDMSIRDNSEKIFSLFYILELIDMTTGFSDPNIKIFNLLSAGINSLNRTEYPKHFTVFFILKYLHIQGILPEIDKCSWCGNTSDNELMIVNDEHFKISCINCSDIKSGSVGISGVKFLNECAHKKLGKIECMEFSNNVILSLFKSLTGYINSYYNIKLKSGSMLNIF